MGLPPMARALSMLKTNMASAPTMTADPITPYMWNESKRNISCMRNQEITSPLVSSTPKKIPSRSTTAYSMSHLSQWEYSWKKNVCREEPAQEEAEGGYCRCRLKGGQPVYGMT